MSIHSQNEQVILEFGLKKPAFRIVVNTPTTLGSIGLTTGLDPAMTLGCGGYGGNITSDNISPRHLLNIKRLAYEIAPVANRFEATAASAGGSGLSRLPAAPGRPNPAAGIAAGPLTHKIDDFLGTRGFRNEPGGTPARPEGRGPQDAGRERALDRSVDRSAPLDFVCEEDVRLAIQAGRTLVLTERAIVTPAARDLGEAHRVFSVAPWRG
jgi:acetaldehyde dehydrogenase (acetylating)